MLDYTTTQGQWRVRDRRQCGCSRQVDCSRVKTVDLCNLISCAVVYVLTLQSSTVETLTSCKRKHIARPPQFLELMNRGIAGKYVSRLFRVRDGRTQELFLVNEFSCFKVMSKKCHLATLLGVYVMQNRGYLTTHQCTLECILSVSLDYMLQNQGCIKTYQ